MSTNSSDSTLTSLSSITKKFFFKELVDEITTSTPLLMKLKGSQETIDGGDDIRVPQEIAYNSSGMWYSGAETLNVSNNDPFFALIFPWAQLNVAVTIPAIDKLKNMGSAKVVDLVKAKMENAKKTMSYLFGTGLYSAGTDPKSIYGTRCFMTTTSTYGGVSQSSESWLQAKMDTSTTALSLSALQTRFEAASEPPIKPNFSTTSETLFSSFHNLLTPIQRFSDSTTANSGFANLLFRGCPVVEDSYAVASSWNFFNLDYLSIFSHSERKFPGEMIDFVQPHNQDVSIAHIRWAGQLICKAPRFQGGFTALTS